MRGEKDHPIYNWDDLAGAATKSDVHALSGFYFGAMADRLVARVWTITNARSAKHA